MTLWRSLKPWQTLATQTPSPMQVKCFGKLLADFRIGDRVSLYQSLTADEFADALVGAKAGLVMSGESSSARAATIASQIWRLGHAMNLAQSAAEFDRLTLAGVNEYIARDMGAAWRAGLTQVTVAPQLVTA